MRSRKLGEGPDFLHYDLLKLILVSFALAPMQTLQAIEGKPFRLIRSGRSVAVGASYFIDFDVQAIFIFSIHFLFFPSVMPFKAVFGASRYSDTQDRRKRLKRAFLFYWEACFTVR